VNTQPSSPAALVRQLRAVSLRFGEPFRSDKFRWLNETPEWKNAKAKEILVYYDTLLAMLAWPENKKLFDLLKKKMLDFTAAIRERLQSDSTLAQQLNGTRIPGSVLTGQFSYAITNWLAHVYGDKLSLHSSEAGPETVRLFFQQLLPAVEYESRSAGELSLQQRIKKLRGKTDSSDIAWLLNLARAAELPHRTLEFLFNELKLFVSWKPGDPELKQGYLHVPVKKIAYHRKSQRSPLCQKIAGLPLSGPSLLTAAKQQELVNIARATLVYLFRETDPFTYAAPRSLKFFELENGLSIALYSMKPGHRLSVESYIGYLVLRNGIPVAYGGGWIFGERCQFGINIPEPFRGAGSAMIFSQLIRTYHQYFGVKRFVVKPYQFGHHNKEALQSGAFWFYYKQGFRSEDEFLQQLAETEWKMIRDDKQYRTPVAILKKFTGANLVLSLDGPAVPAFDAAKLSLAVTGFINAHFHGDRNRALRVCIQQTKKDLQAPSLKDWNHHENNNWNEWSLLAQACLSVKDWNKQEKKQLVQLIKSRDNTDERDFIQRLQKHRRLWKDLVSKFG
jgi:hypothetical protein